LDARLLAEVWLAMTRGQEALLIDAPDTANPPRQFATPKKSQEKFDAVSLPVIYANPEEIAAHEAYLDLLDEAAGGVCVWRR